MENEKTVISVRDLAKKFSSVSNLSHRVHLLRQMSLRRVIALSTHRGRMRAPRARMQTLFVYDWLSRVKGTPSQSATTSARACRDVAGNMLRFRSVATILFPGSSNVSIYRRRGGRTSLDSTCVHGNFLTLCRLSIQKKNLNVVLREMFDQILNLQ